MKEKPQGKSPSAIGGSVQRLVRRRWKWDNVKATPQAIRLAVQRTGNCYGITLHGKPYIDPKLGMSVTTSGGQNGIIVEVRKPMARGGDPEVKIKHGNGHSYLFQTALNGYTVEPPND
jgi:hypothetical protein